ncbi:MAG: zinc finger AN1 domain-containing stress-associated protein [Thaumarchaeota archaeon]|nr:zinc finger AN1 domain-containing stress-associated protein [Nitrososphaerota archaeon]
MEKEKEISFTINGSYVYIKAVYISERQTGQQLMYGEWQNMYSGNALYIETKNIKNDYDQDIVKNLINIACKRVFDQLPIYQPDSLQHVMMGTVVGTYSPDDFINSLKNAYDGLIPSGYMEANKARPASGETLCFQCGQYVGSSGYRCEYCGEILCNEHKDPEKHYCPPFMENHPPKLDQPKQGPNDNEVY